MANQKVLLAKIIELMQARSAQPEMAEMVKTLQPIADVYNTIQGETLTNEQFQAIARISLADSQRYDLVSRFSDIEKRAFIAFFI